jgi:hypothetical protein
MYKEARFHILTMVDFKLTKPHHFEIVVPM